MSITGVEQNAEELEGQMDSLIKGKKKKNQASKTTRFSDSHLDDISDFLSSWFIRDMLTSGGELRHVLIMLNNISWREGGRMVKGKKKINSQKYGCNLEKDVQKIW